MRNSRRRHAALNVAILALPSGCSAGEVLECPTDYHRVFSGMLELPDPETTADVHNPQEADILLEFVVDASGEIKEADILSSKTWAIRKGRPSRPNYYDQAALDFVMSWRYPSRGEPCRTETMVRIQMER